ncbi:DNA-directed RNA polymerase subunit beta [Bienertia sinuspersici]
MEIALASKRKLGFVTGGVKKDGKSVICTIEATRIWKHLENRFSITNGAKKYSLNKQLYETKQGGRLISEYYTDMNALWVDIEALSMMPAITNVTLEISAFVQAFNDRKEELRLSQFLNGLDEEYKSRMSQILMLSKLQSVDETYNMLQQEEYQRVIFKQGKEESDGQAMHSKKADVTCGNCGKDGHAIEKC